MLQIKPELIQALKQPFVVVAEVLLLLSLLGYIWARVRANSRSEQTSRMALIAIVFSVIVMSMAAYQSVKQIESNEEYHNLHAVYLVHASIKGTVRTTTYSEPITFRVSSGQVNVGCNDQRGTNAVWSIPEGASDVQAQANWESTDNIRSQAQNVEKSPTTITAKGAISGLDRNFFGSCSGGGHGELVLRGSYRIARNESRGEQTLKTLEDKVNKGQPFVIAVPRDNSVVPEFCDTTIEEGNRRETVRLALQDGAGKALSISEQHATGDIPVSVSLDQDRIILTIL